jgi:predicted  nucleic acid-binding Zn-ribbon protein
MMRILENLLQLQALELSKARTSPTGMGREELRNTIPPPMLEQYDRLRARDRKGVAFVRHGVCGQCHMQVAVGLQALLRRQDNAYRCENCGSYLYLKDEAEPLEMPPRSTKPARRGRPPKATAHVA